MVFLKYFNNIKNITSNNIGIIIIVIILLWIHTPKLLKKFPDLLDDINPNGWMSEGSYLKYYTT